MSKIVNYEKTFLKAEQETADRNTAKGRAKRFQAMERLVVLTGLEENASTEDAIKHIERELRDAKSRGWREAIDEAQKMLRLLRNQLKAEKEEQWRENCRKNQEALRKVGLDAIEGVEAKRAALDEWARKNGYKEAKPAQGARTSRGVRDYRDEITPAQAVGYDRKTRTFGKNMSVGEKTAVAGFKSLVAKYGLEARKYLQSFSTSFEMMEDVKKRRLEILSENERKLNRHSQAMDEKLSKEYGSQSLQDAKARRRCVEMETTRLVGSRGMDLARKLVEGGSI